MSLAGQPAKAVSISPASLAGAFIDAYPLPTSEEHDYTSIHPKELKTVYIGCHAELDFKRKMVEQMRHRVHEAAILQAVKSESHF